MSRSVFDNVTSTHILMSDIDAATAVSKFGSRYSYDNLPAGATDPVTVTPTGSPFTFGNHTGLRAECVIVGGTLSAVSHSRQGANAVISTSAPPVAGTILMSVGDSLTITYSVAPTITLVPHV